MSTAPCGHADTLREIRHSKLIDKIEHQTDRAKTQRSIGANGKLEGHPLMQGIDPDSEYAQLWTAEKNDSPLLSWLGADIPGYKTTLVTIKRRSYLLWAEAEVRGPLRTLIKLEILIPHPSQQLLAQHNSIMEIANLQPPNLQVLADEDIVLEGLTGKYYRYNKMREKGQECSAFFKAARDSVVNLRVRNCDQSPTMLDVAKRLDFKRFNEKLNS